MSQQVRVGVSVLIYAETGLLLGLRKGSHGANTWAPPGGHIEFGEDPFEAASRELLEETSLVIETIKRGPWSNDYFENEKKHYITLCLFVQAKGEVRLLEADKCEAWDFFPWDNLPENLFLSTKNFKSQNPHPLFIPSGKINIIR